MSSHLKYLEEANTELAVLKRHVTAAFSYIKDQCSSDAGFDGKLLDDWHALASTIKVQAFLVAF